MYYNQTLLCEFVQVASVDLRFHLLLTLLGEAGGGAVILLSNKSKVAPFAKAVASSSLSMLPESSNGGSGSGAENITVHLNNPVIKDVEDAKLLGKRCGTAI